MRQSVRALLAAAVLGVLLPVASAAGAQAAPEAVLDVVRQSAWVSPEGTFLLDLDVHDAPEGSRIETTFYSRRVASRSAFNETLFGVGLGEKSYDLPVIDVDDLAPSGASTRRARIGISLVHRGEEGPGRITFEDGLQGAGAFPLDIRLIGPDGDEPLDRIITHLVRLPQDLDPVEPLRAAMVFPVHAPPSVAPDGTTELRTADLDRIAALVRSLADSPYGRTTLVPTPETIEALAREPGRAGELLDQLDEVQSGHQVVDGPYVDLPVSAWIAAGLQDELNHQRARGNAVLTEHLDAPDRTVWVASPDLTAEAAAELWEGGITRFVLPETSFGALPVDPDEPATARPFEISTRIDAPVQAVAIDSSLSYALGRHDDYDDPELQAQELVAQLAVIQLEAPDRARGVVFGAARNQVLSSRVLSETLALLEVHPLLRAATVAEVFDDVEPARDPAGGPVVTRDLKPAPGPDLGDYPTRLADLRARIGSFSQMVQQSDQLLASWEQRLLASGADELTPAEQNRYLDVIHATIDRLIAAVQSPPRQSVTLTSNEGVIPFTLRNLLRQPVKVTLELEGTSRLEFPGGESRTEATVRPGTNQIRLRVRTRSPGVSPVTVRVTSPDGGLLVTTSRVTVRSTAVSGIGYVLSVGAVLFLVVWWFRHWRRARHEKHATAPT